MNRIHYIVVFIVMCLSMNLGAQVDSIVAVPEDTLLQMIDTMSLSSDMEVDSINRDDIRKSYRPKFDISPDALPVHVHYGSIDSTRFDLDMKGVELWGEAYLRYQSYDLKAGYIRIDFDKKEALASDIIDTSGLSNLEPVFTDGSQNVRSRSLRFNFDTKKAYSRSARFEEGGFYIYGDKTKFVPGSETRGDDSLSRAEMIEDMIFQEDAHITTCNHDHSHFHIRTHRIKIIKDKLAVIGFSQLVIADVPTPLFLPFGLFPLVDGESSGLIFPRNYEYDERLGFGLRGIGYYFPINDYVNLTVLGDIYTRGTHRVNLTSFFKKRYKYNGSVTVEYANNIAENQQNAEIESQKSYKLIASINQDAKAHPYRRFSGSINIQTQQHDQRNYNDFNSKYNNILRSNLQYSNSMPWSPFDYSISLAHLQNIATHDFEVTFPQARLNMRRINPFKQKERISNREAWYEKIWTTYNAELKNNLQTKDSILFTSEALESLTAGIRQEARAGANFKALNYVDINPSITYTNVLFSKKNNRYLDVENPMYEVVGSEVSPEGDTLFLVDTSYVIRDAYRWGIYDYHRFSTRVSASTKIFGTALMEKGWLRGVRHTMTPRIGLAYVSPTDQYKETVYDSPNINTRNAQEYDPYRGSGYSISTSKKQLAIEYGLSNHIEGKYRGRDGESDKKFPIFRSLNFSGSYNYADDSLRWKPLVFNGNTDIIKGFTSLRVGGRFTFYEKEKGRYIDKLIWSTRKRPFAFEYMEATLSTGFNIRQIKDLFTNTSTKKSTKMNPKLRRKSKKGTSQEKGQLSLLDYIEGFRFTHSYRLRYERLESGKDSLSTVGHYISTSGSLPLTKNWRLNVDNISFDLKSKNIVYPSFSLSRDLHCWEMNFTWQPRNATYSFFIGVKSTNLNFLKYNYGQRNVPSLIR